MKTKKATFGAGCFWHVEETFRKLRGVVNTAAGYMGGTIKNPTYEQVCTDKTGYAEVVQIEYDPDEITYESLLDIFWSIHDPTQLNRQGPDIGTQYRSVIFYHDDDQKNTAIKSKSEQEKKKKKRIVTEISKSTMFYKAEDYHQRYLEKRGMFSCKF
ncbi:peptide-methionine (S)-S-oxide reductase MsrA [Halobacteriota archaeon]